MIIGSIKCKICGKEILPPEIEMGESSTAREQRTIGKLLSHLQKRAESEQRLGTGGPHLQAIQQAAAKSMHISGNLNGALLTGNFELPADLEAQRVDLLRQVHEMTRTVRMSDGDLANMMTWSPATRPLSAEWTTAVFEFIQDLRDRYEGLGKYAPIPAVVEMVKQ